jgi:hypothetical protein
MDQITRQSPRQRGYGSTSSLRNDSLKNTRKHEKGREESNKQTKHSGSGGPSGQEGRTVRTGHADRPACCRGLSAHTPRTVRPCAADRPKKQTEPPKTTPNNGPSAGSTRTVRPLLRTVRNLAQRKVKAMTDRKRSQARTRRTREEFAGRGLSATCSRTVRALWTELKPARPRRSTSPIHHRISQTVEVVETKVWGHDMRQPRMLYPKTFIS